MSELHVHHGPADLGVMLATDAVHGDLYDSWFDLPVPWHEYSTERKAVHRGEGAALQRFLEAPVHTGRDPDAQPTHTLPRWIEDEIESVIVQAGRQPAGYTLELVGRGHPSVGWVLQRLLGRRTMRFHAGGPLLGWSAGDLRARAEDFRIAYWRHSVHFALRLTRFDSDDAMNAWIERHPRSTQPIPRPMPPVHVAPPGAEGDPGTPWFESFGAYAAPGALDLDDEAAAFAFRTLSRWQMLKAYWSRGPVNPILNFLNWPIEAYRLTWDACPQGTVLTKFCCDLRFELYG